MYVLSEIDGHQIGFVEISFDPESTAVTNKQKSKKDEFQVENAKQIVYFKGKSQDQGAIMQIQKKSSIESYRFAFDLRYYPAYQGFQGTREGAYIFKPVNESQPFSKISEVFYHVGPVLNQITLEYRDPVSNHSATVIARLFEGETMIEWDVQIDELPESKQGLDITVNFWALDFDNKNEFFTDQNGLEMRNRTLNARASYSYKNQPLSQQHYLQNISANYYPVTRAIAIRDKKSRSQLTIMTAKTHGGSVLKPGRVELMHSRRLVYDDKYSKGVLLNERDPVQATYYMQIFDRDFESSHQRAHQIHIENPPQSFFAFNYMKSSKSSKNGSLTLPSMKELRTAGFPVGPAKIEYMPVNRSQIYFRFDNLEDKFDQGNKGQKQDTSKFNLRNFTNMVWLKVTGKKITDNQYNWISEMSLAGNQEAYWVENKKLPWQAEDDDLIDWSLYPSNPNRFSDTLTLEPQRIRMFYLEYYYWDGEDWEEEYDEEGNQQLLLAKRANRQSKLLKNKDMKLIQSSQ